MQRLPTPMLAAIFAAPFLAAPIDAPLAEDMAPASGSTERPGRYTMVPAEGGFVRLDTETGTVSHCRRDADPALPAWRCTTLPEAALGEAGRGDALSRRIDELSTATAALTRRVTSLEQQAIAGHPSLLARVDAVTREALRRIQLLVVEWKGAKASTARAGPDTLKP